MIYKIQPSGFKKKFDIASCFCVKEDKILLLLRQNHKPQPNTWGIPAGKVNADETPLCAIHRELEEETGLLVPDSNFKYLDRAYVRYPEFDFTFYMYETILAKDVRILINEEEHKDFVWVNSVEVNKLNLIEDLENCIKQFYWVKDAFISTIRL